MGNFTFKNTNDSRYRKSRLKFFSSLNHIILRRPPLSIRPVDLYRRANLSKGTFFHHFNSVDDVLKSETAEICTDFHYALHKLFPNNPGSPSHPSNPTNLNDPNATRQIFTFLTIFILRRRNFFRVVLRHHYYAPLQSIFQDLHPYLTRRWRRYGAEIDNRLYDLYFFTIIPLLTDWANANFTNKHLSSTISKLTAHTEYYYKNLGVFRSLAEIQTQKTKTPNNNNSKK